MKETLAPGQRKLVKGATINLVGKLFGRAVHIGAQILLARWLGPALFGLYAIGWNILRVGTSILPLGIDIALLQIGPVYWPDKPKQISRLLQSAGIILIPLSIVTALLLFLAADSISNYYAKPDLVLVLRLIALALPLALLLRVAAYGTRITQMMHFGVIAEELIQPSINLVFAFGFLLLGHGLGGALWSTVLSFGVALIYILVIVWKIFPAVWPIRLSPDRQMLAQLRDSAKPLGLAAVFTTLILMVDRLMVGFYLSAEEAGVYQAASVFAVFFVTVLSAFKTIVAPIVAGAFNRGDRDDMHLSYRLSTRWGIYLSLPVAAVLLIAPGTTLNVLFGNEYVIGATALIALTVGQIANIVSGPVEYYLIMTGSPKAWVRITAAMLAVNVFLNLIFIPSLGILGAGAASAVTFALTSLISLITVRRILGIYPYDSGYLRGFISAGAMVMALVVVSLIDLNPPWLKLTAMAMTSPIVFFTLLFKLGLEPAERRLLATMIAKD